MTPESLSRMLQDFLGGSRHAVVLEDGARIFDLADGGRGHCSRISPRSCAQVEVVAVTAYSFHAPNSLLNVTNCPR